MTFVALTLVLTSALLHATWNLFVKRAGGGRLFVWLFISLSSAVLVPVSLILLATGHYQISVEGALFIAGTTLVHFIYFLCLQRAYQTGDLSLVYPLARGLGPTLAMVGAILLLDEQPSALGLIGAGLVMTGVVLLAITGRARPADGETDSRTADGLLWGSATGVLIAVYTVWDKYAVSRVDVPPLLLESFAGLGIALMLTPSALRQREQVRVLWRSHRREALIVSVCAPLSYILVLIAMRSTPLSYVAPARECSILIATVMGSRLLGESDSGRRLLAATAMVCGVVALALG